MKHKFFLLFWIFFTACSDIYHLFNQTLPQPWDQSLHLTFAMQLFQGLVVEHSISSLFKLYYFYPPFYYLTTIPFLLFNYFPPYPILSNIFYHILLTISIYYIATELFKSKTGGLVAAISITSFPILIYLRRNYLLDFPVLAMSVCSIAFFIKSSGFSLKKYSIITTILTLLTFFTKQIGIIFTYTFYIYFSLFVKKINTRRVIVYIFLFITVITLWGIYNHAGLLHMYYENSLYGLYEGDPQLFTFQSMFFYFKNLPEDYGIFYLALTLFSTIILLKKNKTKRLMLVFLLATCSTALLLAINPNKDTRYGIIFSFYLALVISGGVVSIRLHYARNLIILLLVVYSFLSTEAATIRVPRGVFFKPYVNIFRGKESDWNISIIMNDLKNLIDKPTTILLVGDHPFVNYVTYNYYALLYQSDIRFYSLIPKANIYFPEYILLLNDLKLMEDNSPKYIIATQKSMYAAFLRNKSKYTLLQTYPLAKDYSLLLYKKKIP